jgi:hypothetical protein
MKCPWTRYIQKKTYIKMFADSEDESTSEIVVSEFGECEKDNCPFFDGITGICKRAKM